MKNAKLTCLGTGTFRALGAALAEGAVSREHVDVARSALNRLPGRLVRDRRDEVDALLTEHARTFDPGTAETLSRHLLSVVAPDRADRYDENALDRRHLSVMTDQTGVVLLNGQLDQAGGLTVATVLDHYVDEDRAAQTDTDAEPDLRTRGQRRADALVQMARAAAEHDGIGPAARAVPRVVVVTTPEQLAGTPGAGAACTTGGDLVGRGALTRTACDAVVDRVVLGQAGRVLAMDTMGRLALLCHRHHSEIHAQPEHDQDAWVMVVRDGTPGSDHPNGSTPTAPCAATPTTRPSRPPAPPACAGARRRLR